MTNMVAEMYEDKSFIVPRPGLSLEATREGAANGIFCFNGQIITVWGTTIENYYSGPVTAYNSGTTYGFGDLVIYLGTIWLSLEKNNKGNTPSSGSSYWTTTLENTTWDDEVDYDIGDEVTFNGVTYYSYAETNAGYMPTKNPTIWQATPPGAARWQGTAGAGFGSSGICASPSTVTSISFAAQTNISCNQPTAAWFSAPLYTNPYINGWYLGSCTLWNKNIGADCSAARSSIYDFVTITPV